MAEGVVEGLEVIQIDEQQRAFALVRALAASACCSRSISSRRLGRPVSGS